MEKYYYAQLNEINICSGVSELKSDVSEYNYKENPQYNPITEQWDETETIFVSRMIKIPVYSENYIGLKYNEEGKWEQVTA